eukprot:4178344-Amphidinium_carterae.1
MAFAKSKAREGDEEVQRVYDQLSDAPVVQQMLEHVDREVPVDSVPAAPTPVVATPMEEDKEEQLSPEQQHGR